jgi:hypothetical protein
MSHFVCYCGCIRLLGTILSSEGFELNTLQTCVPDAVHVQEAMY